MKDGDKMSENPQSPFGEGETVYATEPVQERGEEAQDDEPKYRNKEWLYHQYHTLGLSMSDIAEKAGCHRRTIVNWMDRHDIDRRNQSEALKNKKRPDKLDNRRWLYEKYVVEKKSTVEIGEQLGCSDVCVSNALSEHDIEIRNPGQQKSSLREDIDELFYRVHVKGESNGEIAEDFGVSPKTVTRVLRDNGIQRPHGGSCQRMLDRYATEKGITWSESSNRTIVSEEGIDASWRDISQRSVHEGWVPYRDKDWLEEWYVEKDLSMSEVADKASEMGCDVSRVTIREWLHKHGISLFDNKGENAD